LVLCALVAGVLAWGTSAHAAAQVSKFNIVLSANPTSIDPKDFNEQVIGATNRQLESQGLEGIKQIKFAWLFDSQARYFVRPNFAVEAGVGQMKTVSKREYLPAINAAIQFRAELLSVPVHLGGAYYLPGYNQGDFAARMYVGGGMMSLVYNRAKFMATFTNTDSANTRPNFKAVARRDSPGFYAETGVHMFFGGRYSVLLGVLYRSAVIHAPESLTISRSGTTETRTTGTSRGDIDLSGIGARMALAIGL
jgi:hypothetical protein